MSLTRPLCILIKGTHFLRGNPEGTHAELKGNPVIRLILLNIDYLRPSLVKLQKGFQVRSQYLKPLVHVIKRPPSKKRPRRLSQLYFVSRCISWECSDPNFSSQGVFGSSVVKTLALQPCNKWSLRWSNCREPLFFIYFMSQVSKQWNTCRYAVIAHLITSYIVRGVSAGTLTSCYIYLIV